MVKVTVYLKTGLPVTIHCDHYNDILYESDRVRIHTLYCIWLFMNNEIEYMKIERSTENG